MQHSIYTLYHHTKTLLHVLKESLKMTEMLVCCEVSSEATALASAARDMTP